MTDSKKAAKAVKTKSDKKPKDKLIPVHIKLTQTEHDELTKRANWFCMGNMSAWLRYCGMMYVPKKGENVSQAIAEKKYLT